MDEVIVMGQAAASGVLPDSFLYKMYWWGIEIIRVIQRPENPALTAALRFITALGTEALYLPLILFIFWALDEKQGCRFGFLIIVTAWINSVVKDLLKQPRPFQLDPGVGLAFEPTFGAPSGHAQMSLVFWVVTAAWLTSRPPDTGDGKHTGRKRAFIWGAAAAFVLLIGFTRLYLGVHFPTDLFSGWILGAVIIALWFTAAPRLEKFLAAQGVRAQNIAAAAAVLVMNGLYPKDRSLPALLLGLCLGYTLMKSRFPFAAREEVNGKKPGAAVMLLRYAAGLAGAGILYTGLRLLLPGAGSLFKDIPLWGEASSLYELGRFVRYALLALWVSAGAPFLFRRAGLASAKNAAREDS